MKQLKAIFNFYINSSIHVALAIVAFTAVSIHHLNLSPDAHLLLFIFFSSVTGYNFVKYSELAGFKHFSLTPNLRIIQVFSFLCFLGMIYFALQLPMRVLTAAGILALLNFLYALPFISQSNLRSVAGIKIFIIALVWAGTTVILPAINAQVLYGDVILEFLQRFLFVIVLMLPFEIRDLKYDAPELGTLPQIFGVRNTRYAGLILIFLAIVLELLKSGSGNLERLLFIAISTILLMLLMRANVKQGEYYSSFWVEGIPILWWAMLMVF